MKKPLRVTRTLSRRDLLKGLGIAALGGAAFNLGTSRSRAQIGPTGEEIAAYYRFRLGAAEMIAVLDAAFTFPPSFLGPEEEATSFFAERFPINADGTVNTSVIVLVMIVDDRVVLFDTGNGAGAGKLAPTLSALGIGTESVTDIAVSHLHPDHVNGISTDGALVYPNAMVHFPQGDFDFMQTGPEQAVGNAVTKLQPALDAEQVVFHSPGDEILPGLTAIGTPGHTPGHTAWMIESDGNSLLHYVDAVVNAYASPAHPEWAFSFDGDPQRAVESRQMLLEMAAVDTIPVIGYHFTYPGTGYIRSTDMAYEFIPFAF